MSNTNVGPGTCAPKPFKRDSLLSRQHFGLFQLQLGFDFRMTYAF
ncbi:hypothetical protein HDF08_002250 [Edaphobacter lichenicola]|uniref:Uncharacterized protein n=1 Tax=Tunturiibacter lichenicola TaxID=2051959 RepID=A0A852VBB2_9BACT|nr:hypothetical protein [Edaphobacter lichenicola]